MRKRSRTIRAAAKDADIIAISVPVTISAADAEKKGPRRFDALVYTGGILRGALKSGGKNEDVVIDLSAMKHSNSIVANLDHDKARRVGHVDSVKNDHKQLILSGAASAKTSARDEVLGSADEGFPWQASVEADPNKLEHIASGKSLTVNGQVLAGPFYLAKPATLRGFAFLSHGADDNTTVSIAAAAASTKGTDMDPALKTWIEGMLPGVDIEALTPEAVTNLKANFEGQNGTRTKPKAGNPFEVRKLEAARRREIRDVADKFIDLRGGDDAPEHEIVSIEKMHDHAITAKMPVQDFRNEMYESCMIPEGRTVRAPKRDSGLTAEILQAALCEAGNLPNIDKAFSDQTLQASRDRFHGRIGLKQFILLCAEANGHNASYASEITGDVLRAGWGSKDTRYSIEATGFSTISIPNITSNVANKFSRLGWMSVDQTALRIASQRNARDFKQITTVSLTGHLQYEKVGKAGEIKHGTIGELTYTNQVETYAAMLAITRQDQVNDDLSVLTSVPQRLGRGGMLKINDVFWTVFLNNAAFFSAGNLNVSTGAGSALGTADGAAINAAERTFLIQTDPDGKPLASNPTIMLVPPTLRNTGARWMGSQMFTLGGTAGLGATNIFGGRYTVESSPYMENASYTGNSAAAWYLLASPSDVPVIEIAALNGRLEPMLDTAEADFNTLGIQMRGVVDFGVAFQEFRGGVRSAGS